MLFSVRHTYCVRPKRFPPPAYLYWGACKSQACRPTKSCTTPYHPERYALSMDREVLVADVPLSKPDQIPDGPAGLAAKRLPGVHVELVVVCVLFEVGDLVRIEIENTRLLITHQKGNPYRRLQKRAVTHRFQSTAKPQPAWHLHSNVEAASGGIEGMELRCQPEERSTATAGCRTQLSAGKSCPQLRRPVGLKDRDVGGRNVPPSTVLPEHRAQSTKTKEQAAISRAALDTDLAESKAALGDVGVFEFVHGLGSE